MSSSKLINRSIVVVSNNNEINQRYNNFLTNNLPNNVLKGINIVNEVDLTSDTIEELTKIDSIYLIYEATQSDKDITSNKIRNNCKYDFYLPAYDSNMNNNYVNLTEDRYINLLNERFLHLYDFIKQSNDNIDINAGIYSHFLSLTYPSIDNAIPNLSKLRIGIDAYELRVDLLNDTSTLSIIKQLALLRDFSPLPIVYTVRTTGQLGRYSLIPSEPIIRLLGLGLRNNVEWLDIEACLPENEIKTLCNKVVKQYNHRTKILGSLHTTSPQTESQINDLIDQVNLFGYSDILKVVTGANDESDCYKLHQVCQQNKYNKPYIGLCLGAIGATSRVINKRFTPVTHELLSAAAPGQLSVSNLTNERIKRSLIKPKSFYLFGHPISQSVSPAMHTSSYQTLNLPYTYSLNESTDVSTYQSIIRSDNFGGASVTIPHKESIGRYIDEVDSVAKTIGAINTIVKRDNRLIGYNTDWIGIKKPIERLLDDAADGIAVVIGAGGTARAACYAVNQLNLQLVIYNRSPDKAIELADQFHGKYYDINDIANSSMIDPKKIKVIISTIPSKAEFTVPNELLAFKPIVFDVVYKPARTKLLQQALDNNCQIIQGATMLLEQGIQQFELWHQRKAPRKEMKSAVFSGIDELT